MKIPVDIHVRSERYVPVFSIRSRDRGDIPDVDDYTVSGTMKTQKGGYRIEFCEDGGSVTTLIDTFDDETVTINRLSDINSHLVFAENRAFTCICDTGEMPMQMLVRTKKLCNTLSPDGGKLDIDFNIEIVGNLAEKNRLTFSVTPDISILRS